MAFRRISRFSRALTRSTWHSPESAPPPPALLPLSPLQTQKIPTPLTPNNGVDRGRLRSWSSQALVDVPSAAGVVDVPLAQTGEGIAECELLQWFVQEGDHVEEFQRLCEVQSDKATIEITSRYKGKILQILYVPGDIVKVGETLLKIIVDETHPFTSESDGNRASQKPELSESDCESIQIKEVVSRGVLSTPAVKNLAKQYGLNINDIRGTGKDGRVLKEDVLSYAASKGIFTESPAFLSASADDQQLLMNKEAMNTADVKLYEDRTIPLRGFQRSMVKSMTMAAKVPHFHYLEEINCDALVKLKTAFQNENTDPDVKHTFLPFLIKSLSLALNKYPLLNSSFNEETTEVILKGCHNIGVAMATSYGLVVPNIKMVQSLSILEITKEVSRLHKLASNNKLSTEDVTGGTITLSNIGTIGGKFGSPVINLPEAAIIAIGRMQKLPRFRDDGSVYPAAITNVTIGADHRIIDGATVAKFCNEWKLLIEKPELLLLYMS